MTTNDQKSVEFHIARAQQLRAAAVREGFTSVGHSLSIAAHNFRTWFRRAAHI